MRIVKSDPLPGVAIRTLKLVGPGSCLFILAPVTRFFCLLLVIAAALLLPAGAEAGWTAWKLSGVRHATTWDWRDTVGTCTSADAFVVSEKGSKTLQSLKPKQVHRVARRLSGRSIPGIADGVFNVFGPRGVVEGAGKVAVRAEQVVQRCRITGYDEAGDPQFGPDGAPYTETCDKVVSGRFRTLAFLRKYGRLGKSVGVELREEIGAEPDCASSSGFGILGPEGLDGTVPPKRVPLRRFFGSRPKISVSHSRQRTTPAAGSTVVGTATVTASVVMRRITRPEQCYFGSRTPPRVIKRRFVCTPGKG